MGVLEKLRINPESDEDYDQEYGAESVQESGPKPDENWDPEPGESAPRPMPRAKKAMSQVRDAAPRITKKMRDDAENEITSIVQVLALAWGWQAPPCGDALHEAAPEFAARLTNIVARNPRWLQRVRDGGLIADVIGCFGALAPVGKTAYAYYTQPKETADGNGVEFDPARFPAYDGTGFSRAG